MRRQAQTVALHHRGRPAVPRAAVAMLWIRSPSDDEESELMPLGGPRVITVYDRVIVGSVVLALVGSGALAAT